MADTQFFHLQSLLPFVALINFNIFFYSFDKQQLLYQIMKKPIICIAFITIFALHITLCQQQPYYWDLWTYIPPVQIAFIKIAPGNYTFNFMSIPNINQFEQARILLYSEAFSGIGFPWQITLKNLGFPQFQHRSFGISRSKNEKSFNSENIIVPLSNTLTMNVIIDGNGGESNISVYVTALKKKYTAFQEQSLSSNAVKNKLLRFKSQWDDWLYFQPITLFNGNITKKSFIFDYSKIPNITLVQCIKHHIYYATGKANSTGEFKISWKNVGEPEFQHESIGTSYVSNDGFSFNSQNIILPISKNQSVILQSNTTTGASDILKVSYFGLKFKENVSLERRENAKLHIQRYMNIIDGQSRIFKKNINTMTIDSYPYPDYYDDWFFIEPEPIYIGALKQGVYKFDFTKMFVFQFYDEIKIWVSSRIGVGSGGNFTLLFNNDGPAKFEYFTSGFIGNHGGVTYNSEQFIAPMDKKSKMYLTIPKNITGNTLLHVYVTGLKFEETVSGQMRKLARRQKKKNKKYFKVE